MKNNLMKLAVAVVVISFIAGPAFAWGGDKGKCGDRSGKKCDEIKRDLGLTQQQEDLLSQTREAHRTQMKNIKTALGEKKEALKAELDKPGVTAAQVAPIVADIKNIQSEMVDSRVQGILKVKSILTPEQYSKLQAMKEARRGRDHGKQQRKRGGW